MASACIAAPSTGGPSASSALTPSPATATVDATAVPTSSPSPFTPSAWSLGEVPTPPGHGDVIVRAVSADRGVVVFQDRDVFDTMFVENAGVVSALDLPGHEDGAPVFVRMSPDSATVLVASQAKLWKYTAASRSVVALPAIPGAPAGSGIVAMGFDTPNQVAFLLASGTDVVSTGNVFVFDPSVSTYRQVPTRSDATYLYATATGPFIVVDESQHHDSSRLHVYRVAEDGSTTLVADASGSGSLAVSPDGAHIAMSIVVAGKPGVTILDTASGSSTRIPVAGSVQNFSPDGKQLAVVLTSGRLDAYSLDGHLSGDVPNSAAAWWLPAP